MWQTDFPVGRVSDLLRPVKRSVKPSAASSFQLAGVRLYGNGLRSQGEFAGADLKSPSLNRVERGDVLYNKMWASKGAFGVVSDAFSGFHVTSEYPLFRTVNSDPAYIRQLFARQRFWKLAEIWSSGSTDRTRLNPKDFLALPVPVPPVHEQAAIGLCLDGMDKKIHAAGSLVRALERAKRDAMRRLLTLGMKGDAAELTPLKENWVLGRIAEGVEAIPKDWRLVQLTKYAKLESGHTPSRNHPEYWEGDIPWVSLADTDRFDAPRLLDTTETIGDLGLKHSSARLLPEGTVVFSRTATVGKAAILGRPMATSQDFADWVCGSKLSPRYLLQVFRHMSREWKRLQAGSTHQTIYMPTFKKLQILLPPFHEQEAIADVGEAFDRRIAAERTALDELRASKDALAQELLSGRVRLPEATIRRLASTDHAEAS